MKKVLLSAYACIPNQGSEEATGWMYATALSQSELEVHCLTLLKGKVEELLRTLLGGVYEDEALPDGATGSDRYWSTEAESICGWPRKELLKGVVLILGMWTWSL